jgi:hypothetical protein
MAFKHACKTAAQGLQLRHGQPPPPGLGWDCGGGERTGELATHICTVHAANHRACQAQSHGVFMAAATVLTAVHSCVREQNLPCIHGKLHAPASPNNPPPKLILLHTALRSTRHWEAAVGHLQLLSSAGLHGCAGIRQQHLETTTWNGRANTQTTGYTRLQKQPCGTCERAPSH